MKAFRIDEPGKYSFIEIPKPVPKKGEVLIKIARLGFCGSDMNIWRGLNPLVKYPRIIGHEISGEIEEVTSGVPDIYKPGMRVTVIPYTNCGTCAACRVKKANACKDNQTLGVQRDGASTEYISVPWEKLVYSSKLSHDELVLLEPLSVGFHAVKRGKVTKNEYVAVFGCGMIGLGALLGASAHTGNVIAIDIAEDKLKIAGKMGAAYTINPSKQDVHDSLVEITGGFGPDIVIEAAGSPVAYLQTVSEVAFAGRIVYIGYVKEDISFSTKLFVMKELDIHGSRNADIEDLIDVMKILEENRVSTESLITRKVPFLKAGEALAEWSENPSKFVKIIIDLQK